MKGKRKTIIGRVVSDKMDKTVVVKVETLREHARYKRYVRYSKKYKAHDAENACKSGDQVRIMETRPLSREKRWVVVNILSKGTAVDSPPVGAE